MVVPRFVQQALAGEPITVYGDDVSKIRAVVEFVATVDTTTSLEKVIRFYRR